jgi:hypothetical protein
MENEAKRLLTLRMSPTINGVVNSPSYIIYRSDAISLSPEQIDELSSLIPDRWHNAKDKITHFVINEKSEYFCEKEKQVFNFATKSTELKWYEYDAYTKEEAQELTQVIFDYYNNLKIRKLKNIKEKMRSDFNNLSYFKTYLIQMRNEMLKESDYIMMPDYPMSEIEKQKWTEYRQNLRDLTAQEAWVNRDYLNIEMPVSPNLEQQYSYTLALFERAGINVNACETSEDKELFLRKLTTFVVRQNIINSLVELGLPNINKIVIPQAAEFSTGIPTDVTNFDVAKLFDDVESLIDEEIAKIDVTITIQSLYEQAKSAIDTQFREDEINSLLNQIDQEEVN